MKTNRFSSWVLILAVCVILAEFSAAHAQSMFSQQNTQNPTTGRSSATSSAAPRTGSTTGAPGGTGARTNPTAGGTGIGGNSALNTQAGTGTVDANFGTGMVGRGDNARRFVGNQLTGAQSGQVTPNQFGTLFNSQFGRLSLDNNFNQQSGGGTRKTAVRPTQKVAFSYPKPTADSIRTALSTRFETLTVSLGPIQDLSYEIGKNGEVTLRGVASSADSKQLAANIVRLEPGVRSVRNELTVADDSAEKMGDRSE